MLAAVVVMSLSFIDPALEARFVEGTPENIKEFWVSVAIASQKRIEENERAIRQSASRKEREELRKAINDIKQSRLLILPTFDGDLNERFYLNRIGCFRFGVKCIKVTGPSEFLADDLGSVILIRGLSTEKISDDDAVEIGSRAMIVSGTQKFSTAIGGQKLLKVLEPFDTTGVEKYLKKK